MTWIKIDDQFPTHPKVIAAGGDAAWLHVCALCYCGQHLTDGFVPKAMLDRLSDRRNAGNLAARLIEVGMWIDRGTHIEIHEYLEYNPSREQVLAEREKRSKAGAMGAAKRWGSKSDSTCHSTPHDDRIDNVDAPVPSPTPIDNNSSERSPKDPYLDEFAAWWVVYPRKVRRADAFRAYRARRREGVTTERLLAARDSYAHSRQGQDQAYTMHGSTFLAKDGPWSEWEDGPPEVANFGFEEKCEPPSGPTFTAAVPVFNLPPSRVETCPECESSLLACQCVRTP